MTKINIKEWQVFEFKIESDDFKTFKDFTDSICELLGYNFSNLSGEQKNTLDLLRRKSENSIITYPSRGTFSGEKFYEFEGKYSDRLPRPLTLFCDGKISPEEGGDFDHILVYITPQLLSQNPRFVAVSGYSHSTISIDVEAYPHPKRFKLDKDGDFIDDDRPVKYAAKIKFEGPKNYKGTYFNSFFKGVVVTEKLLSK